MEKENSGLNVSSFHPKPLEVLSTHSENTSVFDVKEIMQNINSLKKACRDTQSKIPYTSPSTGKVLTDPTVLSSTNRVTFCNQIDEEEENELDETTDRDTTMHMVWETPKHKIKSVDNTVCYDEARYDLGNSHEKPRNCKTCKVKGGDLSAELGYKILQRQKEIRKRRLTDSLRSYHSKTRLDSESEKDILKKELELQKEANKIEKERNSLLEKITEFHKEKEMLIATKVEIEKTCSFKPQEGRRSGVSVMVNVVLVVLGYVLFYLIAEILKMPSLI
jgi:hypothetical protein